QYYGGFSGGRAGGYYPSPEAQTASRLPAPPRAPIHDDTRDRSAQSKRCPIICRYPYSRLLYWRIKGLKRTKLVDDQTLVMGIDLGGTNLRVAAVDVDGHILARHKEPSRFDAGPEPTVRAISQA